MSDDAHTLTESSSWKILAEQIHDVDERTKRMESILVNFSRGASDIRNDVREAKDALKEIRDTTLGAAIRSNHIDVDTHKEMLRSQNKIAATIITVLIFVIGFLLIGEKMELIRSLAQ